MQAEQPVVPADQVLSAEQPAAVQNKVDEPTAEVQAQRVASPVKEQAPTEDPKETQQPVQRSSPQVDVEMRPVESTQADSKIQPVDNASPVVQEQIKQQAPATQAATRFIPKPSDPEGLKLQQEAGFIYVDANIYQAAMLNKQLPLGFRIDLEETVSKQIKQRADALKNSLKNAKKMEAQRNKAINRQIQQVQHYNRSKVTSEVVSNVGGQASNGAPPSDKSMSEVPAINVTNLNGEASVTNQTQDQPQATPDKPVVQTASATADSGQQQAQQPLPQAMTPVVTDIQAEPKEPASNDTPAAEGKRSTRERKAVDYNSMASGTGASSAANMAYPEIQPLQRQPSTIKKPGQKLIQEVFRKCCDLIKQLKEKPGADFLEKALDPNHVKYEDLKKDFKLLSLVEKNLHDQKYQTTYNMALDLRKMFTNRIRQFQISDCEVSTQVLDISTWFEETFEAMDLDNKNIYIQTQTAAQTQAAQQQQAINAQVVKRQASQIQKLEKKVAQIVSKNDRKKTTSQPQSKQSNANNNASSASNAATVQQVQAPKEDSITMEEKTRIKNNIQYLTNMQQQGIIDLVKDCINQKSGHVFEFELDQLPVDKCRSLEKYVSDCIKDNERKRKRRQSDQQRRQRQKQLKLNEQQQHQQIQQATGANASATSSASAQNQQKQYEQMPVEQVAALLAQNPNLPLSEKKRNAVKQYQILQQKQQQALQTASSQNQAHQQVVNQPPANTKRGSNNGGKYQSDQSSSSSSDDDEGFPPQKNAQASQQAATNAAAEGDLTQMWSNIQSSQQANK